MGQAGSCDSGVRDEPPPNPISECLRQGRPIEELRALVRLVPWRLERRDDVGGKRDLPLHVAVRHGATPEAVWLIARTRPRALRAVNADGCVPLHVAAALATVDVVEFLAKERPEVRHEKDHYGRLPLHPAVANATTEDVVRAFVETMPNALEERVDDGDGWLPLHLASQGAPLEIVRYIAKEWSPALQLKTAKGSLPMHIAAHSASPDIISFLAVECPDALWVANDAGELPVDVAARMERQEVVDLLQRAMDEGQQQQQQPPSPGFSSVPCVVCFEPGAYHAYFPCRHLCVLALRPAPAGERCPRRQFRRAVPVVQRTRR
jgi:hypothetical protein